MADLHKLADKLLELADQISELFNEVEAGELSAEAAISTLQFHPQLIALKAMELKAHAQFPSIRKDTTMRPITELVFNRY